jgi:DNA-binding LytR/AlgR family response regulator
MQDFLFIKIENVYTKISFSDIIYIESLRNYARLISTKNIYIILVTMKHVEEILPQNLFCRIHRSFIVSLNHVTGFNSNYVYIAGKSFPLSEQYRVILMQRIITLSGEPRNKLKTNTQAAISNQEKRIWTD